MRIRLFALAGGRPLSKIIEDLSLELSFLFWQLRMDH
jgi:hypothetical protein